MFDGRLLRRLKGVKRVLCHIFTTFSLAMPTLHMRKNETVHRGSSEAASAAAMYVRKTCVHRHYMARQEEPRADIVKFNF